MEIKETILKFFGAFFLYLIASLIMTFSLIPSFFLVKFALELNNIFFILFFFSLSYFVFGITLMIIVALIIRVFRIRLKPGIYKIGSKESLIWLLNAGMISLVRFIFLSFTRSSINNIFYKIMGAKIGKNVIINTTGIYDPHLLEIGDNTVIGGDAIIIGHSAEGNKLIVAPIKIGKNVTIGQYTTILPGAIISDNVTIGAMSLVPKFKKIKKGIWGGVPIRRLK
ncbi:MAG: DapH/DapD/GlmU-related protein [Candidatus Aenigmatarchaeota archaeon]